MVLKSKAPVVKQLDQGVLSPISEALEMRRLERAINAGDWKEAGRIGARSASEDVASRAVEAAIAASGSGAHAHADGALAALEAIALRGAKPVAGRAIDALHSAGRHEEIGYVSKYGSPHAAEYARSLERPPAVPRRSD
jgi:hypothetical protein